MRFMCFSRCLRIAALISAATAVLSGCSMLRNDQTVNDPLGQTLLNQSFQQSTPATETALSPLLEAADRTQVSCVSKEPLSTQRPLNRIVFVCPELSVQATLEQMRDAGWRMIALDIGKEHSIDGILSMPLSITIIKLF